MTKRNHNMALIHNERGQISIFFSAALVVMVSIVAFVINVGLFVKAKINLQNATDAAAYSGASVQARQLSKIAYLNWDMRNIYKEWLYKYYVVGNLNLKDVQDPSGSGVMQFTLEEDVNVLRTGSDRTEQDQFNIPAVCVHITGSKTNICKRYSVPGLPEFGSSNLPGAEEASRAFLDTLISTKVNDCIDRTRLNMGVATNWTYNVLVSDMDSSLAGRGPAILANRQGAWPRAVELALRIRNLEFVMNRPAETSGVCARGSSSLTKCSRSILDIESENKLGNERIVKAYYSGYRNLGNEQDREMKESFTLTEIPPRGIKYEKETNASNLLIPDPYEKQFVDLKLMMVNYAIFYAAMIPVAEGDTSGRCDISKVAIPVPGYPMGFYKDPDVLTYYAVRGEAEFTGMFNPFNEGSVKMTAYAAAKPFGGRIGPKLFMQKPDDDFILARSDSDNKRSVPYITSFNFEDTTIRGKTYNEDTGELFIPGLPLPTNSVKAPGSFWLEAPDRPLGGKLADAGGVQFGVPNLVYDYETPFSTQGYTNANTLVHTIESKDPNRTDKKYQIGLYSKFQFNKFKGDQLSDPDVPISPDTLDAEIARVRAPTSYEAANYLIPTPNEFNLGSGLDSFGFITTANSEPEKLSNGVKRYRATVYAPLFQKGDQQDLLYKSADEAKNAIFDFMRQQKTGMDKYRLSLNRAARNIFDQANNVAGGADGSKEGYQKAARGVSNIDFSNPDIDQMPNDCTSLAGQFLYFYYGGPISAGEMIPPIDTGCPTPLSSMLEEYFSSSSADPNFDPNFYAFDFSWQAEGREGFKLMTAYRPGPFTGVEVDGSYISPISSSVKDEMPRNTYSTKFVSLNSLQPGSGGPHWDNKTFSIYAEGPPNRNSSDTAQTIYQNPPQPEQIGADLSSVKY